MQIGTEWQWCYDAIDLDSMVVLDVEVFSRRGTDPAAAFLHRLTERHDLSAAELLVDSFGYRTALSRLGLSGQVEYSGRNHIERWFQTLKQRTDRFYTTWNSGPASTRRWLQQFVHFYNTQRPHQAHIQYLTPGRMTLFPSCDFRLFALNKDGYFIFNRFIPKMAGRRAEDPVG